MRCRRAAPPSRASEQRGRCATALGYGGSPGRKKRPTIATRRVYALSSSGGAANRAGWRDKDGEEGWKSDRLSPADYRPAPASGACGASLARAMVAQAVAPQVMGVNNLALPPGLPSGLAR